MLELQAQPRNERGKRVKAVRAAGFLPAVVYGDGVASQPIAVSFTEFERAYRSVGESSLLQLKVGEKPYTVVIHDIVHDPLTDRPTHADFYAVRMDRLLKVSVPLEFTGESGAVKNEGGILVKVAHELEIEAMPSDLPHGLSVDVSLLAAWGDRILVKNISVPRGVVILAPPDEVVAIVEAPRSDEELAALAEAPAAETAEVKTEKEMEREIKAKAEAENSEEK